MNCKKKNVANDMTVVVRPNNSIDFLFRILTLCGIWMPPSYLGTWKELSYNIFTSILMPATAFVYLFTQMMDIYMNFGDIEKNVDTSLVAGSIFTATIKAINIIIRRAKIQQIRDMLESDNFTHVSVENGKLMNKYMTVIQVITKVYILFGLACTMLWAAFPIFDPSEEKKLPLRAWFPWDLSVPSNYYMLYTYQVIGIVIIASFNTSQDAMMCSIVILLCAELDMLYGELSSLGQDPDNAEAKDEANQLSLADVSTKTRKRQDFNMRLRNCIIHHKEIIECGKKVEDAFNGPIFVQFLISCITVCVVAFQLSVTKFSVEFLSQFVYMCTIMMELFLFCYPGNEMMVKSQLISTAAYLSPWYDQNMEFKKMMLTLMERSKRPVILSAGHVLPLTLKTLTSILQSSYSYYIVLQRLHAEV